VNASVKINILGNLSSSILAKSLENPKELDVTTTEEDKKALPKNRKNEWIPSFVMDPIGVFTKGSPGLKSARMNNKPSNPSKNPKCLKMLLFGLKKIINQIRIIPKYASSLKLFLVTTARA